MKETRNIDILYTDSGVSMEFAEGKGNRLFIACRNLTRDGRPKGGVFKSFTLPDADNHVLFFQDVQDSWMNGEGLMEILVQTVEALMDEYDIQEVYSLGSSLGAFIAFLIPHELPVKKAVGLGPQYTVNLKLMPDETRWKKEFKRIKEFRYETLDQFWNPKCEYIAFFGEDCENDIKYHAKPLSKLENITVYVLPDTHHVVTRTLRGKHDMLEDVLHASYFGGQDDVLKLIEPIGGYIYC